ncbi:MAG: F0F1 ATP synthase subunit epsilon [Bacteroidales bacterium]|nr:F0F1 ATP synthase subunit epsilon [Bacteroidales bacterium]MBR0029494.1 F0F1 ATP synthase subunit epsilon [Bacteroidales bacterium]MBR0083857.1 F0F1 ATP synthase subunit epsilon [Bacteroidales bacterium]
MSFSPLSLKILTPEGAVFEGPVKAVWLPGSKGRFELLPGHAPLISSLEKGTLQWAASGGRSELAIRSGVVIVDSNTVTVCVQSDQ